MFAWNTSPWIQIGAIMVLAALLGVFAANSPEEALGIGMGALWTGLIGVTMYRKELWRSGPWWARVIVAGLLVRIATGPLHLVVGRLFYKSQVDLFEYFKAARVSGESFLRGEFIQFSGERVIDFELMEFARAVKEFRLVEHLNGVFYLLTGSGEFGLLALAAAIGFFGSYLFWRAFRIQYANERGNRFFALMIFFLPSLIFWTSSLGKDSWMLFFLGWAAYAFSNLTREKMNARHLLGLAISIMCITLIRYPIGIGITVALVVAFLLKRWRGEGAILEPVRLALYCAIGTGLLVFGVGRLAGKGFSSIGLGDIANPVRMFERMLELAMLINRGFATTQGEGALTSGFAEPTLGALISYLPGAIFTFLFRPIVFEAHHALALAAALEGTFFLVLVVSRWRNLGTALRSGFREPFIMFCLLALLFLVSMLSLERNLGAIVRHRSMVLPFLLVLLSVPPSIRPVGKQFAASGPDLERRGSAQIPG